MWFKLYTNEVFRKREKIAITVVYYKYTTSSDLTILCSFMLHYYSIKETTVWYGNVYLYIQLLQLLEDLFGSYVYVARLGCCCCFLHIVWYGNVYLYIQLLQLLEDLFGSYVYVARLGTKF